jgi:UDP-N-acetylmuramoyl-L-alanyl-D-glutamate--2,6-diaminopimelate ligase
MKLSDLLIRSGVGVLGEVPDVEVSSVAVDSRKVGPGTLFVAQRGSRQDGNLFADQALAAGAVAVLTDSLRCAGLPRRLMTASAASAAGALLRELHGRPDQELRCFAVTGTNGKTTTAFLAEAMFREAGLAPALLSTVANRWPGHQDDASMTTPAAVDLWNSIEAAKSAGARALAMEVSSHALHQERVAGLSFDAAVFTNLTRDHLDYHGDFGSYFAAKSLLFTRHLKAGGAAVVNLDDPHGQLLRRQLGERVHGFSMESGEAEYRIVDLSLTLEGLSFRLEGRDGSLELRSPLLGKVYAQNLAGAAIACLHMGLPADAIVRAAAEVTVPGRCELVRVAGLSGIVDYAHTPDALERLLAGLRPLVPGRLVCVFGCGGDRDRGKRPQMGEIAARLADRAVVTSDNPRSEDPGTIVDEVLAGAPTGSCERVVERREAIRAGAKGLRAGDLLVVAGKGHEKTQTVGSERHHFDDVEELRAALGEA